MNTYKVSFFGHREIDNLQLAEDRLFEIIYSLITSKPYIEFLVGRNGEYDKAVASVIRRIKKTYQNDNFSLTLILPYATAEFLNNQESFYNYYDDIIIYSNIEKVHFKSVFQKRNKYIVDNSNLIIFYIERNSGGAYKAYQYAKENNKEIINIYNE